MDRFLRQTDFLLLLGSVLWLVAGAAAAVLRRHTRRLPWGWFVVAAAAMALKVWLSGLVSLTGDTLLLQVVRLVLLATGLGAMTEFALRGLRTDGNAGPRWLQAALAAAAGLGLLAGLPGLETGLRIVPGTVAPVWAALALLTVRRHCPAGRWPVTVAAGALAVLGPAASLIAPASAGWPLTLISRGAVSHMLGLPVELLLVVPAFVLAGTLWLIAQRHGAASRKESGACLLAPCTLLPVLAAVGLVLVGWAGIELVDQQAWDSLKAYAGADARLLATHVEEFARHQETAARTLADQPELAAALASETEPDRARAVATLRRYTKAYPVATAYLMAPSGVTVAASNEGTPESFRGRDYGFRPYFREAMRGRTARFFGYGVTSRRRGLYTAHPVHGATGAISGVAVIKVAADGLERQFEEFDSAFLVDPHGIVFLSSWPDMVYSALWPLDADVAEALRTSRQFGADTFAAVFPSGDAGRQVVAFGGRRLLATRRPVGRTGWLVYLLTPTGQAQAHRIMGMVLLPTVAAVLLVMGYALWTRGPASRGTAARGRDEAAGALPPGVLRLDPRGRVTEVGDGVLAGLGLGRGALVGRRLDEAWSEAGRPAVAAALRRALQGRAGSADVEYVGPDGGRTVWHLAVRPSADDGRGAVALLAEGEDAETPPAPVEAALDPDLAALIDCLPDATVLVDRTGRVVAWNRATEELTGVPRDDVLGRGREAYVGAFDPEKHGLLLDLLDAEGSPDWAEKYDDFQRRGETVTGQTFSSVVRGGEGAYLWATARPVRDAAGRRVGAVEIIRDVTTDRQARRAAELSETRFREMAELLPIGVYEMDTDGNLAFYNQKCIELFRYGPDNLPDPLNAFELIAAEDRERVFGNVRRIMQGEDVGLDRLTFVRNDGTTFPSAVYAARILRDGVPIGMRGILMDLTEQVAAEEAMENLARFPREDPSPVLRAGADGTLLYANAAARPLLEAWGAEEGRPLPAPWPARVRDLLDSRIHRDLEIEVGSHVYSVNLVPVSGAGYVNLYGRDVSKIKRAEEALKTANERLKRLTTTDELTALANRRRVLEALKVEAERFRRHRQPLALALVDVDRFREINEAHGHAAADKVLRGVAHVLKDASRLTDVIGRYGADEFAVLMPNTTARQARKAAERVRQALGRYAFTSGGRPLQVTVSVGIGDTGAEKGRSPEGLLHLADEALRAAKREGADRVLSWRDVEADASDQPPDTQSAAVESMRRQVENLSRRSWDMFVQSVQSLVQALEARDPYTRHHSDNVTRLAVGIGRAFGMDDDDLVTLRRAALVHDIGKIGVPDAILRKPGPLTPEERQIIERHPLIGVRILDQLPFLDHEIPIVRHHHERWDGRGYPDGLAGPAIPLGARVLAVADAFDAITSQRVYREARSLPEAMHILVAEAGRQFDSKVVDALLAWVLEAKKENGGEIEADVLLGTPEPELRPEVEPVGVA